MKTLILVSKNVTFPWHCKNVNTKIFRNAIQKIWAFEVYLKLVFWGVNYFWIWVKYTSHLIYIYIQGVQEKVKKSNHLVWYKNKVKFLFLAHQLRGNMCPFCLITQTKPLCLLFWSKISMQKNHRNAKKCHFRPILANWLYQKANWGPF